MPHCLQNSSELAWSRGVLCDNWVYTVTEDTRVNTYNFYVNHVTGHPVQYHMLGYDSLFVRAPSTLSSPAHLVQGSHYDEYVMDYMTFSQNPQNPELFEPPTDMECGAFPGMCVSSSGSPLLLIPSSGPGASDARDPRYV